MERTLVLLKPDCVQRRLMGTILGRFEQKGLNVIAMKMMVVTPDLGETALCRACGKALLSRLGSVHHRRPHRGHGARGP